MAFALFYQQVGCLPDYVSVCFEDGDLIPFLRDELTYFVEYPTMANLTFSSDQIEDFVNELATTYFLQSPTHPLFYFSLYGISSDDAVNLLE